MGTRIKKVYTTEAEKDKLLEDNKDKIAVEFKDHIIGYKDKEKKEPIYEKSIIFDTEPIKPSLEERVATLEKQVKEFLNS